jgi:hypothetical protein
MLPLAGRIAAVSTALKLTLYAAWWGACFAGYVALRYWL